MGRAGTFFRRLPLRLLKALGWTLLVVVLILLAALDIARLPSGQAWLRQLVLDQTAELVPGLRLGGIAGDYTSELTVLDVTLRDRFGGEAIHVDRLTLRYDLSGLASKRVEVDAIEIDGLQLTLRAAKSGKLNLAELVVPSDEPEPPPEPAGPLDWTIVLGKLQLTRGEVTVAIDPKQVTRIRGLELLLGAKVAPASKKAANPFDLPNATLELRRLAARVELPDGKRIALSLGVDAGVARLLRTTINLEATLDGRPVKLALRAKGPLAKLGIDSTLTLPDGGEIEVEGWAGLRVGAPAFDLTAKLRRVNPRALLPELPAADVNLGLRASGDGIPLQPGAKLTVALDVGRSRALGYGLDAVAVRAALTGKRWKLARTEVRLGQTRLTASGEGDLERFAGKLSLHAPRLDRLPLPKKGPRLGGALRLTASAKGAIDGDLRGRIKLAGQALSVDKLAVGSLELDTRLDRVPLGARGDLQALLGGLRGAVKLTVTSVTDGGKPLVDRATVDASGSQKRLALAVAAKGPGLAAELDARASVGARQLRLDLRRLRLKAGRRTVALRNEPSLRFGFKTRQLDLPRTRLALLGGEIALSAKVRAGRFLEAEADVDVKRIKPLPKGPRISARLAATVGRKQATAKLAARLEGVRRRIVVDARLPLRQLAGAPTLDEGRELAVSIAAPDLPLGLIRSVAPAQARLLSGEVGLEAKVEGTARAPRVALDLGIHGVGYKPQVGAARVKRLDGTLALRAGDQRIALTGALSLDRRKALTLDLAADIGLGPLLAELRRGKTPRPEALPLTFAVEIPGLPLKAIARAAGTLPQGTGEAFVRLTGQGTLGQARASLRAGLRRAVIDQRKLGDVEARVDLEIAPGRLAAKVVALENGQALLTLDGSAPIDLATAVKRPARFTAALPKLALTADGKIPAYSLKRLRRLDPMLGDTAGTLGGTFRVRGTVGAPRASAELALRQAVYDRVKLGDLTIAGRYHPGAAEADVRYAQHGAGATSGGKLSVVAKVDLARSRVDARVRATALDLGPLRPLVPAIKQSAGKLAIDLHAQGELARPAVRGTIQLERGAIRLSGLPAFTDLGLKVSLSPERVRLERLRLRSGGTLSATGQLDLDKRGKPRAFALDAKAHDLGLSAGSIRNAVYNGPVRVRGKISDGSLDVNVALIESRLKIPQIKASRQLHPTGVPKDVVFVDRAARAAELKRRRRAAARAMAAGAAGAAAKAMKIKIGFVTDPLFVNGKEADVELATDLKISVDEQGRPRIKGTVRLRRGWIKIIKHRYEINEALVLFSGDADPDPALSIRISHAFPEAVISIGLQGTAKSPKLELRADPPIYDRSQIISLILTGRTKAVGGGGGAEADKGMMVANAVAQMMLGGLMDWIAPQVGLDVASVNLDTKTTDSGETKVRAKGEFGKFLTDRIFIAYRPLVGGDADENTHEGLLEYRITARWLLMATFGNAGVGGLDLYWVYRY